MGWATQYIEQLLAGQTVQFRPHGNSMKGRVNSGDLCTVMPITEPPVKKDVVLCRVGGSQYLHLVNAVRGDRFQIANNHGRINGWIGLENIYGLLIAVET